MSATDTRVLLADAEATAAKFVDLIRSECDQVMIAGSIRRRVPLVGDIEIVATPSMGIARDMFGQEVGEVDLLDAFLAGLLHAGVIRKRQTNGREAWGPKHKRLGYLGMPVDLFCPSADRWGLIVAIRTGPHQYSTQLVTHKGATTRHGRPGLLPPHLRVEGGWLRYRVSGQPIPTPTEEDFFAAIDLAYVPPEGRY